MHPARVLVVEDEPSIREVVDLYLNRAGYEVVSVATGTAARDSIESTAPDLVVLDLMLPGVDGLEIARWIRDRSDLPIIMLTARRGEADRVLGLETGADDYVVKPFSPQELVSRVRAVLRRYRPHDQADDTPENSTLECGDLRVDERARTVMREGEELTLTAREFDLLVMLLRHPRQVFSRNQLLEHVWGIAEHIDPSTVTVHVRRLREKIEPDASNPRHIVTVWGVGYRLEP